MVKKLASEPTARPGRDPGRSLRRPLLAYAALAFLLTARAWLAPQSSWVGGIPDPDQSIWYLEWMPFALSHGLNLLHTTHVNYPVGINLTWQTWMPLLAFAAMPITVLLGPVVAYNALATLAIFCSCVGFHLAARRWITHPVPLAFAATLYGVSPYLDVNIHAHLMLAFVPLPPLLMLILYDLWSGGLSPRRGGLLTGTVIALQFLISIEIAVMMGIVAGVALVALLAARVPRGMSGVQLLRAVAWGAIPVVLVVVPLAGYQLFGPDVVTGTVQPRNLFLTDLLNFIVPTQVQLTAPPAAVDLSNNFSGNIGEWTGYVGIVILPLVVAIVARRRNRPSVRWLAVLSAGCALLSLGPSLHVAGHDTGIPMPWWVFDKIPVVNNLLPDRFSLFAFLGLAVLAGLGLEELADAGHRRGALVIGAVAVISVLPEIPLIATSEQVPAFFAEAHLHTSHGVLIAPIPRADNTVGMLWQARSNLSFPADAGYYLATLGTSCAVCTNPIVSDLIQIEDTGALPSPPPPSALADLIRHDTRFVILGPMQHDDIARTFCDQVFGTGVTTDGVTIWSLPGS